MIDLEERLREDFATLTDAPLDLGVKSDDVIAAGRQRRRSRTVRRGIGAVAVAALAAAVGWTGLSASGSSVTPVVPAAPAASHAWLDDPAYFSLTGLSLDASTAFRKVALDVHPADDGWDVTALLSTADGRLLATYAFQAPAGESVQKLSPQVSVALLPTRTSWWDVAMKDPEQSPVHLDSTYPGALDLTIVLIVFDSAKQSDDLAGLIWQAPDGSLVDSLGDTVPTATVTVRDRDITLYHDTRLERVGYRLADGLSLAVHTRSHPEWVAFPRLQYYEVSPQTGDSTWVLADLLPAGAHDLEVRLASTRAAWTTVGLGGRTAYVIVATAKSGTQPVRSLRYVTAGGGTASFRS